MGFPQRLIAVRNDENIIQLANPVIIDRRGENVLTEECLSIPEVFVKVGRSQKIKLQGMDGEGNQKIIEAGGILARIFQHAIDHLNGILLVDYAKGEKKNKIKKKLEELVEYTRMILRIKNNRHGS